MSTLNAALTYKLQKMERTLSSLMEENRALRTIINEANFGSAPEAFYGGGGAGLGAWLANQPNVGVQGVDRVGGGAFNTSGPSGLGAGGVGVGTPAARSLQAQAPGSQVFNGEVLGQLLASGDINAAIQYLSQFASQTGVQTAGLNSAPQTQRRR